MPRPITVAIALLSVAGPWLAAAGVSAQSQAELDRARDAFREGVAASDAGRWQEAVDRFREVMEVRATGQVKYNLAVALEQTGEVEEADQILREVVDDRSLDRRTRRDAQRLLDSIQPRVEQARADREAAEAAAAAAAAPTPEETARTVVVDEELYRARPEEEEEGGSIFGEWWFWAGAAAVILGAVLVGVLASSGGGDDPIGGNLDPGVLSVRP